MMMYFEDDVFWFSFVVGLFASSSFFSLFNFFFHVDFKFSELMVWVFSLY